MSEPKRHVGFAEAINAGAEGRYAHEVAALSSLPPEQARIEAVKIMRGLAYTSWHHSYGTAQARERFDALWRVAFPDEKGARQ